MSSTSTPAPAAVDWRRLIANSALGLVGDTGSGKTTLICTLAEYVYQRYGKITRYYSTDPGGFGDLMYSLIIKGIVQVWRMRTRDPNGKLGLPSGTCSLATRGYWPAKRDPLTGHTDEGVALVPPYATLYTLVCPQGHPVRSSAVRPVQGPPIACPECKTPTSLANCRGVEQAQKPVGGFERVGCLAYDSGTAMADWAMVDVDARAGRDELGGEKGAIRTVHSSGEVFGTAGRAGVGFVQNRGQDWIYNAIAVPGLVVPPVFTFRKDRGEDQAGLPIHGPKLIGRAKTADIPGWLGNCFGVEGPGTSPSGQHRLYLSQYKLADGVTNLVKHRAAAGLMPEFLEDPPGATVERGDAYTQFNLGTALEMLLAAVEKTNARIDAMFPEGPGVGSGELEVPEGLQLNEAGTIVPGAAAPGRAVAAVAVGAVGAAVVASAPASAPAAKGAVAAGPARAVAARVAAPGNTAPAGNAAAAGGSATPPAANTQPTQPTVADVAREMTMPQTNPATPQGGAKVPMPPAAAPRGVVAKPPAAAPIKK